jgi:hypothetical protein
MECGHIICTYNCSVPVHHTICTYYYITVGPARNHITLSIGCVNTIIIILPLNTRWHEMRPPICLDDLTLLFLCFFLVAGCDLVQVCSQFYFREVHDSWLLLKNNDIRRLNTPRTDTQYHSLGKPTICYIQIWRNLLFVTSKIFGKTY